MNFTYDTKAFRTKGQFHVVALPQATTVAALNDLASADEDAANRSSRAAELQIKTRYEVHPAKDGQAV